jgi:hypothetical protein
MHATCRLPARAQVLSYQWSRFGGGSRAREDSRAEREGSRLFASARLGAWVRNSLGGPRIGPARKPLPCGRGSASYCERATAVTEPRLQRSGCGGQYEGTPSSVTQPWRVSLTTEDSGRCHRTYESSCTAHTSRLAPPARSSPEGLRLRCASWAGNSVRRPPPGRGFASSRSR